MIKARLLQRGHHLHACLWPYLDVIKKSIGGGLPNCSSVFTNYPLCTSFLTIRRQASSESGHKTLMSSPLRVDTLYSVLQYFSSRRLTAAVSRFNWTISSIGCGTFGGSPIKQTLQKSLLGRDWRVASLCISMTPKPEINITSRCPYINLWFVHNWFEMGHTQDC